MRYCISVIRSGCYCMFAVLLLRRRRRKKCKFIIFNRNKRYSQLHYQSNTILCYRWFFSSSSSEFLRNLQQKWHIFDINSHKWIENRIINGLKPMQDQRDANIRNVFTTVHFGTFWRYIFFLVKCVFVRAQYSRLHVHNTPFIVFLMGK